MKHPLKQIKSLIKEIEDLKFEGPERLDLPQLTIRYETWYTNALRLVQNLIPERLEDFVSAYKNNRSGAIGYSTYAIQDYLLGIKVDRSSKADFNSALLFERLTLRQAGILNSALQTKPVSVNTSENPFQEEFYERALDKAQKLFGMGQLVPAGVLAGTVLENYLKWMCRKRHIKINEELLSTKEMNDSLYKFRTYKNTTWIRIKGLIPLADACLDPQKKNPPKKEIGALIAGVRKILGTGL